MKAQDDVTMNPVSNTTNQAYCCHRKVIIWSAIIAGALIIFGLTFLLQIFDKALGIQIFRAATEDGAETMVWGGFIASIIGIIASMFFAGWVSGHIARYHIFNNHFFTRYTFSRCYGLLYGLLSWCLGLIISLIFIMHMGTAQYSYYHSYRSPSTPSLSVVGLTTHQTASEMTEGTSQRTGALPANSAPATKQAGVSLFLTFLLFFIGAISSCFGGYYGLKPYPDEEITAHRANISHQ